LKDSILTYHELNETTGTEINKRVQLEAEISYRRGVIEQEKVGFIEKEKSIAKYAV